MAWVKTSKNQFEIYTESSIALADSGGAVETSANTSTILRDIGGKKLVVYVEVTEACAGDGALDCRIQGSHDGTTFVNVLTTVSMDVDPTSTNKAAAVADLTSYALPFWRIQVFSDGTDTQDAAALTVAIAVPAEYARVAVT